MKIAIVTGGRKGIGYACAATLTQMGYFVIVTGRGDSAYVDNENIKYIQCDNSDVSQIKDFVKRTVAEFGRIDLLVNNAGVAPKVRKDILRIDESDYNFCLDTNLKGCYFMTQCVANEMIKAAGTDGYSPRIINISSVSAYASSTNRGEYCISKAGISMVTKLFADRLAEYSIPVFEIRPGVIETDMTSAVKEKYEKMIADGLTPIKRIGNPQDVANCVEVLAGGKLDFATGQVINADGGFSLRRL
ncbi:MAG: 3-ketoacyl-ACP reductase [Ruminococcaceae bacterium]|nr:3-ketoacyl-ACP reductase [Oscillospiraceae bacterium]